jgi:hypothetical protein
MERYDNSLSLINKCIINNILNEKKYLNNDMLIFYSLFHYWSNELIISTKIFFIFY